MKIEGNIATYKSLTEEEFKKGLMETIKPKIRDFHALTGAGGAEMFHGAMEKHALNESINRLVQEGKITLTELISISKMIDSPDRRDYELAKSIINSKI